ncbi:hypothetical protein HHI36_016758 [Cryptolaemus montrouzieri]|uniref:Uncharacterized protein n=1 Tax=Cryptolaemus montrouzieri TaxID=559131 RepID=A0ABD2NLC2_9CUCU
MGNYPSGYFYLLSLLLTLTICSAELTFKYITLYNKEGRLTHKDDLHKESVNVLKPIIIIINGLDSSDNAWVNALIEEYLEKQVHNIFLLELDENRQEEDKNGNMVSTGVKEFLDELYVQTGEKYLHWHMIGIAGPAFEVALDVGRKMSTTLIDVVHSNIRKFNTELENYGHVDFFIDDINCKENKDPECGRLNAIKMFKRSINSDKLTAVKCSSIKDFEDNKCSKNSQVVFGENTPMNAEGAYILKYE